MVSGAGRGFLIESRFSLEQGGRGGLLNSSDLKVLISARCMLTPGPTWTSSDLVSRYLHSQPGTRLAESLPSIYRSLH